MTSKEKPILFSGPMVRAIIDGRKTQTRRIVKDQVVEGGTALGCPYGTVGDQLWVKEAYYQFGNWEKVSGVKTKTGRQKWKFVPDDKFRITFDAPTLFRKGRHHKDPYTSAWHKRLGRFMPKSASRITLEITAVRVERLQDITEDDAMAEGIILAGSRFDTPHIHNEEEYQRALQFGAIDIYKSLWESINGPGSWTVNPWVWVIEFKKLGDYPLTPRNP